MLQGRELVRTEMRKQNMPVTNEERRKRMSE